MTALAKVAGLSRFHFHRTFRAVTGVTPAEYANAKRTSLVRDALSSSGTITEAFYRAGFNSSSRFYEDVDRRLGMTPTEFRDGGRDAEIYFAIGESSMGSILAAQTRRGVCAILMGDDPEELLRDLQDRFPKARLIGGVKDYEQSLAAVVGISENPNMKFELPLDIRGTAFQKRVWNALRLVPPGTTTTYKEIAERIGNPKASRAVAQACAANALAIAIPCHRVVRNNGSLSGYRWGIARKRALLNRESQS